MLPSPEIPSQAKQLEIQGVTCPEPRPCASFAREVLVAWASDLEKWPGRLLKALWLARSPALGLCELKLAADRREKLPRAQSLPEPWATFAGDLSQAKAALGR
jgi:hypothetical protein